MNYAIRNNRIHELRIKGQSLRQIGERYSLSKQRVCQVLDKYMTIALISLKDIKEIANIGTMRFYSILKKLNIDKRTKWDQEVVNKILLHLSRRKCAWCEKVIPSIRYNNKYCGEECYLESVRYKNLPRYKKDKHIACVKRWEKNNPEAARRIQCRASRKYQQKHR